MPSQSINTEIIKGPDRITQSTLSKSFTLLLIEDHEIITFQAFIQRGGGEGEEESPGYIPVYYVKSA